MTKGSYWAFSTEHTTTNKEEIMFGSDYNYTVEELEELNKDNGCSLHQTPRTIGEVLDATDIKDIKDLKDADVYFVVDRDADPSVQQKTLIRLSSQLSKPLGHDYNIMTKEASIYKMYALVGMASLYGYTVKVQKDYKNGSVPRGVIIICEAGDDLTEVACTLNGLPSMGCSS